MLHVVDFNDLANDSLKIMSYLHFKHVIVSLKISGD